MIYLDMDGVVADFNRHTRDLNIPYNHQWYEPRDKWTAETLEGERIKQGHMDTAKFWATMPAMPDADELYWGVAHFKPYFLTAKPRNDSPDDVFVGKLAFIHEHIDTDFPKERLLVSLRSTKPHYIGTTGHRYQILVDDDDRNCKAWAEGKCPDPNQQAKFVHHFSAKNSLKQIDDILNG